MQSLYEANGYRKYLTQEERAAFLKAAERAGREVRTSCGLLAYTGCRISEALQLTANRVDLAEGVIVFESLKKRKSGIYRAVPVPPALLDALDMGTGQAVMQVAELTDPASATPKGLRHSFGVAAVASGSTSADHQSELHPPSLHEAGSKVAQFLGGFGRDLRVHSIFNP